MITNPEVMSRDDEASARTVPDSGPAPPPVANRANPTERVIAVFTTASRGADGARESAFDAAVRAYIDCYPGTSWNAAARIVAGIVSHAS